MSGDGSQVAGVDVGGTFTDVVVLDGDVPRIAKVPTTPDDQSEALADGVARAAGQPRVAAVAHGTTTATNAVLERTLARTVLVTTDGFKDLLVIARQNRPSLYDLSVVRPEPIVPPELTVSVTERMGPSGEPVIALSDSELARVVDEVCGLEPEAVAICLLFSYAGPVHERRICAALADRLDVPITVSSELLPEFREYERASTCVLDAAVAPVMRRYLRRVLDRLPGATVSVMTSGGGVAGVDAVAAAPVHTLLSGPAAGVVGAAAIAAAEGFADAAAFDMGGTSTDVCLIRGGRPEVATDAAIGGLPFATPAVAVHTVGAGGGSIAWIDPGGALRVGPQSAGAAPGPASYGRGGTAPTVTDAHAVLGQLVDEQALGSDAVRLDRQAARAAMAAVAAVGSAQDAAQGILTVVQATMLRALRRVTTERGVDPSALALVAYGGAGPLHATALARQLGCQAAVIPAAPGVLSALGLLLAPPRRELTRTVMARWDRDAAPPDLQGVWAELSAAAGAEVPDAELSLVADCRYAGQSHELRIDNPADGDLARAFDTAHAQAYGYELVDETVEVVTVRAVAIGTPALTAPPASWDHGMGVEGGTTELILDGATQQVPLLHRAALRTDEDVDGPALIVQPDSTTLLLTGDTAHVTPSGNLVVRW